jgi:cytochrome c peroxidase
MNQRSVLRVVLGLVVVAPLACGGADGAVVPLGACLPGAGGTTGAGGLPVGGAPAPDAGAPGTGGTVVTPDAGAGGADGGGPLAVIFSEEETDSIMNNLAVMPPAPWEDKTNKYGDNPAAAVLGQKFYFESRYSANGKVSCSTCHSPSMGFQDARANTSSGPDATMFTGRHAPTVINAAYGSGKASGGSWHFWDGRADSQWSQALGPPESGTEMGGSRTGIALLIQQYYKAEYELVFNDHPMPSLVGVTAGVTGGSPAFAALSPELQHNVNEIYVNFGKAIAAYERKIISRNSRYDQFLTAFQAGDPNSSALTYEEKLGLKVFVGKGLCVSCHRGPNLTDWKFHNIGTQQLGPNIPAMDVGRQAGVDTVTKGAFKAFNCMSEWSDHPDKTQCAVATLTAKSTDLGAFKTPGLRDVSKTAPYKHTGRLKTLEEVVEHYDMGGGAPTTFVGMVDAPDIAPLHLTVAEKAALVKFMKALDGEALAPALMTAPALPGI